MMRLLVVVLLLCACSPARPADIHASAQVDFATSFRSKEDNGYSLAGSLGARIGDLLSLELGGRFARLAWGGGSELELTAFDAGARLDLDVLWLAPYISLRLGWLRVDERDRQDGLGVFFGVGLDFLLADFFSLGLCAEYLGMLSDFSSYPAFGFFGLRAGLILPL